eukprot:NODE_609_length_5433_cov_1.015186.p1 type:complete len:388 gc:universal NODE_609_length_5433_cov_1.015186:4752-3589(-)
MLLRRREFKVEDSLLDQLFEQDKHVKSIYSIAFAIYLIFLINLGAQNYIMQNRIFDLDLILWAFEKWHITIIGWCINVFLTLTIYFLNPKSGKIWLIFGWFYMFIVFLSSAVFTLHFKLPLGSAMIIMAESIRLVMKTYAFIYARVMNDGDLSLEKKNDDKPLETNYHYTGFHHYIYFLLCPSMVFRNEYPLRDKIRWKKAIRYLVDALCCVFFLSMIWINTSYLELHRKRYTTNFFIHYFNLIIPGTMISFLVFYGFLHSWLNFMSEILRFGDRRFYSEWWTASSYSEYYRRWVFTIHIECCYLRLAICLFILSLRRLFTTVFVFFFCKKYCSSYSYLDICSDSRNYTFRGIWIFLPSFDVHVCRAWCFVLFFQKTRPTRHVLSTI